MKKILPLLLLAALPLRAEFTSLNLGLDYHVRGISIENNDRSDKTKDTLSYYSQRARFYTTAWLNEDVEAAFRLQSINLWGMEGTNTLLTRYPKTDGTPWVEEAYVHLPNMAWKHVNVTIGRQPILLGDGLLVSSDDLGFNALRAQVKGPWKTELDIFTAKISESLNGNEDSDLKAVVFRAVQEERNWELAVVQENRGSVDDYILGGSTVAATNVRKRYYDVRLFGDLVDAFYKIEIAVQQGESMLSSGAKVDVKGLGQRLELGAQKDTAKWGRFGVKALYAQGTGDDPGSINTDEAFRPSFSKRWDGLQRSGFGTHFAATLSDAYAPSSPFTAGTSGLPAGTSGVRTMGLGLFSTQKVFWTGSLDYYTYEARVKPTGVGDLGSELDLQVTYRYTGFVTFTFGAALFTPGAAYGDNVSRVTRTTFETHVHF